MDAELMEQAAIARISITQLPSYHPIYEMDAELMEQASPSLQAYVLFVLYPCRPMYCILSRRSPRGWTHTTPSTGCAPASRNLTLTLTLTLALTLTLTLTRLGK